MTAMANRIIALFDEAAQWTAKQSGHAHTFALAITVVLVWPVIGPAVPVLGYLASRDQYGNHYCHIPHGVPNSEHADRDTEALQLKIGELIRVTEQARNRLINLEDLTEDELDRVKES
jgi:low affinity Fe/Cu permease